MVNHRTDTVSTCEGSGARVGAWRHWLVEIFHLPSVDTSRDDGPVRDDDAVTGQDDAVGLGDLDIPEMAASAPACAGHDLLAGRERDRQELTAREVPGCPRG